MTTNYEDGYSVPVNWNLGNSRDLEKTRSGTGTLVVLLVIADLLLVAGIVLSVVGYNLVTERLDNIENDAHQVSQNSAPAHTP